MLLSKLSLGTAQFGSRYGISAKHKTLDVALILSAAKQFGITMVDTSPSYGEAEVILGGHDLSGFKLITKTLPQQPSVDTVLLAFLTSLENLKLKKVYGLLIHQTSDSTLREQVELLISLKERGFTEKIGVSVYSPYELRAILKLFTPDLVSIPANILDQRFFRDLELMSTLAKEGVEIHTRSTFLQGLLFMAPKELPARFDPIRKNLEKLTPHLALEYVKRQIFMDYCTLGVESLSQFIEICNLWTNDLPKEIDFTEFKEENPWIINPSLW